MIAANVSFVLLIYISLRAQADLASGKLSYDKLQMSTENCSYNFIAMNSTPAMNHELYKMDSFQLHHISFHYYSFLGSLITILGGYIVTLLCGDTDPSSVDLNLLAPFLRKYFKQDDQNPRGEVNWAVSEYM